MNAMSAGRTRHRRQRGAAKLILVVSILLCSFAVLWMTYGQTGSDTVTIGKDALTYKVFRDEFVASVNEKGDIESSSNVEIRCEVKARGKAGTAILEIVQEGTIVKKGDFLCQLDDSVLQNELVEQQIRVAEDKAALIQAQNDLVAAKGILTEFLEGTYDQELAKYKAEVSLAEEAKKRADEYLKYSTLLNSKGYITRTQLQADRFAAEKAALDLDLAKQEQKVFTEYTRDRLVAEYRAEIKKKEAEVEAQNFKLKLSESRRDEFEEQIAACRIVAPAPGMVVYANENDRRGDSTLVIEEGTLIRDGQPIFRLPDPDRMQVRATVNDSKINAIEEGQAVLVRVDTDPEKPVRGVVRKVSAFPKPRRWYQAPIEYEVFVDIVEKSPLIRPGLRGKVEIFTERIPNALQSPVSSLVRHDDRFFVIQKDEDGVLQPREVIIGSNNDQFIVLKDGVEQDIEVLVDPDEYVDDIQFPSAAGASEENTELVSP